MGCLVVFALCMAFSCLLAHLSRNLVVRWCTALFAVAFVGAPLHAQTVQFTGVQNIVQGQWSGSTGIASDSAGNIYVANFNSGDISKISAGDGSTTVLISSLGGQPIRSPQMLAIGPNNILYVAEHGNNRVDIYSLDTDAYYTIDVSSVFGVAVDASGNIFNTSDFGASSFVSMIPVGTTSPTIISRGGYSSLSGITLDASGNVYVSDQAAHTIYKLANASWSRSTYLALTDEQHPYGIAFDAAQRFYLADAGRGKIYRYSSFDLANPVPLMAGNSCCDEVALDSRGNVYAATYSANYTSNPVTKFVQGAYNFSSISIGSTSAVASLSFGFSTGGKLGSAPSVVTQGASGLDFADAGTGTCTTNDPSYVYNAGDICTVDVAFSPKLSGPRNGAVMLKGTDGGVLATGYIYGAGVGPQVSFSPGVQSVLATGLRDPRAITASYEGTVYIADTDNHRILVQAPGAASPSVFPTSALYWPLGVAVGGDGSLYIGDTYHFRVLRETPVSGGFIESVVVSTGLNYPKGVAVDAYGAVYIADAGTSRILKETPMGSTYVQSVVPTSGMNNPQMVALDGSGNLYITDTDNNRVLKETFVNGSYMQSVIPTSVLRAPQGIAVDASGNVYIADSAGRVLIETLSGGSYVESSLGSGLSEVDGVTVDALGNVYIADTGNNRILKLDYADAPNLNFAATDVGARSSAQIVTLRNIGNVPLAFPVPASGSNPAISSDFSIDDPVANACPRTSTNGSAGISLIPGVGCTFAISFVPTVAGSLQGNIIIGDTNLNAANALQAISLGGTGLVKPTNLVLSAPPSAIYGNPVQVTASISITSGQASSSVPSGIIAFPDQNGSIGSKAVVNGSATQSYLAPSIGIFTLSGVFSSSNTGYDKSSGQAAIQSQ